MIIDKIKSHLRKNPWIVDFYSSYLGLNQSYRFFLPSQWRLRKKVGQWFLRGIGIEIGALTHRFPVPRNVQVKYVDRMSTLELEQHYPERQKFQIVPVDIVSNGETLESISADSQDFVIASHFLEHCENPILAIENMLRVVHQQGVILLVVPNKDFTFDKDRELTSFEHMHNDYLMGPSAYNEAHYLEWTQKVSRVSDPEKAKKIAARRMAEKQNIHFHTFTSRSLLEFLVQLQTKSVVQFSLKIFIENKDEMICVLAKS